MMTKYSKGSLVCEYPFRFRMSRFTSAENLRYSFIAGDIAFKLFFFFFDFIHYAFQDDDICNEK